MVHTLRLDNYSTTPRKLVLGTNSSFGTESIKIERGAGWDGLNLTATWHIPGREEPLRVALLDGDAMDVPPEVTKEAKDGVLVLAGLASGVQRASCNVEYLILEQAGVYGGADAEPTPELAAQVLEATMQAKANAEAAAQDASEAKANANKAQKAAEDAAKAGPYAEAALSAKEAAEAASDDAQAAARAAKASETAAAESASNAAADAAKAASTAKKAADESVAANIAAIEKMQADVASKQAAAAASENAAAASAVDAAGSAAQAETLKTVAAKSASDAQGYMQAASGAATASADSATAAKASAAQAGQSADAAATSANTASASAENAGTMAGKAATSADAAGASEQAAARAAEIAQAAAGSLQPEVDQIKEDLSALAPAGAAVGQLFRVAAISEDGKYTMGPVDMPSGEAAWKKLVDVTTEEDARRFTFTFEEVSELIVMISGIADAQRFNFYSSGITNFYHYAFLRASKESSNYLHIHKRIGGMRYMESGNVSDETPTKKASYVLIQSTSYGILANSSEDTISNLNFDGSNLKAGAKIQIFGR
uniref:hypothetical protein n=1 Tax=Gemmiger formicilis TaxID=745368 RepID=UPI003FEE0C49